MALVDVPLLLIHKRRTPVIQSCTFLVFFQVVFVCLFLIFLHQLDSNNKAQMMPFHCFFPFNQLHYFISLYMLLSCLALQCPPRSFISFLCLFVLANIIINGTLSRHFWTSKEMTITAFLKLSVSSCPYLFLYYCIFISIPFNQLTSAVNILCLTALVTFHHSDPSHN